MISFLVWIFTCSSAKTAAIQCRFRTIDREETDRKPTDRQIILTLMLMVSLQWSVAINPGLHW